MVDEIKETLYLAISLTLAASFMVLVVLFNGIGYNIRYASEEKLAKSSRMVQEAELYKYVTDGDMSSDEKVL